MSSFDFEVIAAEETALGMICLRERARPAAEGGRVSEITLDHQFLMSSANTASERALSRLAIAWHGGSALRVLVGGLGLGYTALEALRSPRVAGVHVVELLKPVIAWHERGLVPAARELLADARLRIELGDVYARLLAPGPERFDVIAIDVDHSPDERLGPASDAFYTPRGLGRARRRLAAEGVFGLWSYTESPRFAEPLRSVFRDVRVEAVRFDNPVTGASETNFIYLARN